MAIKRVINLREIAKTNKKDFAYHKYAKQVIFLMNSLEFHFTDDMGLELAEDIAVDISFKDSIYRQHRITDATLARYVRSGYHWALFNDGYSEETINGKFGYTKEELMDHYLDFEKRFYKGDLTNLTKRNA